MALLYTKNTWPISFTDRPLMVAPGMTEIQANLTKDIFSNEQYRRATLAVTPIGRLGRPDDLVPIAVFLASDESRYATGALFFVDGGMTMA